MVTLEEALSGTIIAMVRWDGAIVAYPCYHTSEVVCILVTRKDGSAQCRGGPRLNAPPGPILTEIPAVPRKEDVSVPLSGPLHDPEPFALLSGSA